MDFNNSFLLRITNSLPCRDLNPGPPGTKLIAYQCATVLRLISAMALFFFFQGCHLHVATRLPMQAFRISLE